MRRIVEVPYTSCNDVLDGAEALRALARLDRDTAPERSARYLVVAERLERLSDALADARQAPASMQGTCTRTRGLRG